MKKQPNRERNDDLRPEYDLSAMKGGVRGKYAKRFRGWAGKTRKTAETYSWVGKTTKSILKDYPIVGTWIFLSARNPQTERSH